MIIKVALIALLATSGAVVTIQSQKSPGPIDLEPLSQEPQDRANAENTDLERLLLQLERLGTRLEVLGVEVEDAAERAEQAEQQVDLLEQELEYCREIHVTRRRDRGNCTPSRALLVRFNRALRDQGNERLAMRIARDVAATVGDDNDSLNSYTWRLLTKSRYRGKHDDLALLLAERMQSRPSQLNHLMLDTIALAKFRTGYVDEAIEIQRRAIKKCGGNKDYSKRLKMYQQKKAECASTAAKRIN